jgi:hypothetical protein
MKQICIYCKKEFNIKPSQIKKGGGKFCSIPCKGMWQSENKRGENSNSWKGGAINRECEICGKIFKKQPLDIKKGRGRFCSGKCQGDWQSQYRKGKNSSSWKGGISFTKRICPICKKEFSTQSSDIKNGHGKYCSKACFNKHQTKSVEVSCNICQKIFLVRPSEKKRGQGKFCSRKCQGIWQAKNLIGIKSFAWKGDRCISPFTLRIRNSDKYSAWKLKILERDNFTCQKCFKNRVKLHVHHKKGFSALVKEVKDIFPLFNLYEGAMAYKPLWDTNNGITLCDSCHKKEHSK